MSPFIVILYRWPVRRGSHFNESQCHAFWKKTLATTAQT